MRLAIFRGGCSRCSLVGVTSINNGQIVVEALTRNVKEDHVREIFGKYGVIKDLRMPMNPTCKLNFICFLRRG